MLAQIANIFISPIFISVLVLLISLMTLIFRLKAKKSTVMHELTQQANLINDSTAPYGIRGP